MIDPAVREVGLVKFQFSSGSYFRIIVFIGFGPAPFNIFFKKVGI
jgi:hypothetical protein